MKTKNILKITKSAVFLALIFAATWISIPSPVVGNINLGDCMIILSAFLLGGPWAALAAGAGAALSDLTSGYSLYAPATFIIKAVMVLIIIAVNKLNINKKLKFILSCTSAEIFMVLGYFIYEATVLSFGIGAVINMPFNIIQGAINIVAVCFIYTCLYKAGIIKKLSE